MKSNKTKKTEKVTTHEGARAYKGTPLDELRRTLSTCLLFEDTFYEGGDSIADRLAALASKVKLDDLIVEINRAKHEAHLRHAPLWMAVHMARNHNKDARISECINNTIFRADELAEFVSMYWKAGRQPLSKQAKLGLSMAFSKFDEYQFAKYNRDADVKLKDVMFLVHPKPEGKERAELYKRIAGDALKTPDTWEVALSSGGDKKEHWTRLLKENKLGGLALIRNLRNMDEAGVDRKLVISALKEAKTGRILPYQLLAAYRHGKAFAKAVDDFAIRALTQAKRLPGTTILLIDVSGSMDASLAGRSKMNRIDAACALGTHVVGVADDVRVFTFSNQLMEVSPTAGFGMADAINHSQSHSGTDLFGAVDAVKKLAWTDKADRFIVVTDEQAHPDGYWSYRMMHRTGATKRQQLPTTGAKRNYMVNVAPYQYGVAKDKGYTQINGFSTALIDWIIQEEEAPLWD